MATFDIATPAGGDSPTEADDRMREIKAAIQERLAVEHHFDLVGTEVPAGGDTGKHTDITSDSIVNVGDVATATLTATGNASVGGNAAIAGGATVGGDAGVTGTLGVTGIATVAKGSLLASTDAPTTDAMIANKKYVDDQILAAVPVAARAKAWASWSSDGTLLDSYNVASVARTSEGVYRITWSTAFADANYAAVATPTESRIAGPRIGSKTTGRIDIWVETHAGANVDSACDIIAFGTQ